MIAIVDYGSQYTQLIAKKFRRAGYLAKVYSAKTTAEDLKALMNDGGADSPAQEIQGLVLSGSPSSVGFELNVDVNFLKLDLPILGICFGYQDLATKLGGRVEAATNREYGEAWVEKVNTDCDDHLLDGIPSKFKVWMSHGDSVVELPKGTDLLLQSKSGPAAFRIADKRLWGLQFHPEVYHSQYGTELFENFAKICGLKKGEWTVKEALEKSLQQLKVQLADVDECWCAVSGGVDSTVLAVLLSQVTKVKALFVDHGFLRAYDESDLKKYFAPYPNIDLEVIDAREVFWKDLKGQSDPETKRKAIGRMFIETFYSHIGAEKGTKVYLGQGTIYSDVIESAKASAGVSHNIKSHHNVGGLPDEHDFVLVEPLREFFKDEVREIGALLGIHEEALARHPFPGPGLAIRCLGDLTPERIEILKKADDLMIRELKERGLYTQTWQAFCVLTDTSTVGVMGDARSYESVLALRAVSSSDAMTAEVTQFPMKDLCEIATKIVNEIHGVNRVVYDITGKPPGTIEWE